MDELGVLFENQVSMWTILLLLAAANERIVEVIVDTFESKSNGRKLSKLQMAVVSFVTAFGLCYSGEIMLFSGNHPINFYVNVGLTAAIVSFGSVFVHDGLGLVVALKDMFKTNNIIAKDIQGSVTRKKF